MNPLEVYAAAVETFRRERTEVKDIEAAHRHYDALGYAWRAPQVIR